MPPPSQLTTVYSTDESIYVRCTSDYPALTPVSQSYARGLDGVFVDETPWILSSVTVDFEAQGVRANQIVVLTGATGSAAKAAFPGSGEMLAVESVTGHSMTLRRPGDVENAGAPPGAGGITGVQFSIETLAPQIEEVSFEINRRFGIDPAVSGRAPSDAYDLRDLRNATVCWVLKNRYMSEAREGKSDFAKKAAMYNAELQQVLGRLSLRWTSAAANQSSGWFGMRLVR